MTLKDKPFENILGKEENAGNQHIFFLFTQCFLPFPKQILNSYSYFICHLQMLSIWTSLKFIVKSLPNDKISDSSKLKAFADDKSNITQSLKFVLGRVENIVEKGKKCWLPAFSPFPAMISKGFLLRAFKSQDCVIKS